MHSSRACCLLVLALMTTGCGDGGPPMGEVAGSLIVNNKPVDKGSIAFFPVDGKAPTTGTQVKDGRYSARVPVGLAKVQIRVSKVVGKKKLYDTPDSDYMPLLDEVLPAKYNDATELTIEVKPGLNQKDFDLKGK